MTASIATCPKQIKGLLRKLFSFCILIAAWHLLSLAVGSSVLIPSPYETLVCLVALARTADFWQSAVVSLCRILLGWLAGVLFGIMLAAATSFSRLLRELFSPLIGIIRATPVASFILLALVWLQKTYVPVLIVFLMVLPIVWANASEGFLSADKKLLELARVYRFGFFKTLRGIYIPSVLPYLSAGALTSMGLGWKAGIAAEVIAVPLKSIGAGLHDSKIYIETPELFAWTAVVIIMSLLLEKGIKTLAGRWRHD